MESGDRRLRVSKSLLSEKEKSKITLAVTEAEKNTSGEIVLMIVRQSDTYPGARWRLAICFSLLVALALYGLDHLLDPIWYLAVQIPALLVGHVLSYWSPLLRLSLSEIQVNEEVHQRAIQAFHTHHLSATQGRTGVLIFISILEHRVEILADQGIHNRVQPDTWLQIIRPLLDQVHQGNLTDGVCHAIHECGVILSQHFPAGPNRENQLSNHVLIEE